MHQIEYTKMFALEESHFWFVGKRYFVDVFLEKYQRDIHNILDLGSGTGGLTKHLEKYGTVNGIENSDHAIKLALKRKINIKKGDINKLEIKSESFDLVTLFDVLYHKKIEDESLIIKNVHSILKKKGYLLITDSALEILRSSHDKAMHGKKRFSLNEIRKLVEAQNFKVLKSSYIYFSIFPIVLIYRSVISKLINRNESSVNSPNKIINFLLAKLIRVESILLKYITFPIGSTVILLARKK